MSWFERWLWWHSDKLLIVDNYNDNGTVHDVEIWIESAVFAEEKSQENDGAW